LFKCLDYTKSYKSTTEEQENLKQKLFYLVLIGHTLKCRFVHGCTEVRMDLKDRVEALMLERELTQEQVADMAGVSQNAVWKILAGKTLKPRCLPEIATALGVTVEYLVTGERNASPRQRLIDKVLDVDDKDIGSIETLVDSVLGIRRKGG
jgi:transcriptional regulator with XRE-family HTH domain